MSFPRRRWLTAGELKEFAASSWEDPVTVCAGRPHPVVLAKSHVNKRAAQCRETEEYHDACDKSVSSFLSNSLVLPLIQEFPRQI